MKKLFYLALTAVLLLVPLSSCAEDIETVFGDFEAGILGGETLTQDFFQESKLTMVNVWATYCPPCLIEMPDLAEISKEYDTEVFQILGIVADVPMGAGEDDEQFKLAMEILDGTGASNYTHVIADENMIINCLQNITAVPTTIFIDSNGQQVGKWIVGALSKDQWIKTIEEALLNMDT